MSDVPEFHGNPNDYDFNPEFVFKLKAENAALQSQLTAERELSGALAEALNILMNCISETRGLSSRYAMELAGEVLHQYNEQKGE